MKKSRHIHLKDDIFNTHLHLYLDTPLEDFDKICGDEPSSEVCEVSTPSGLTVTKDRKIRVWVDCSDSKKEIKSTIIHELIHVVNTWIKDRGMNPNEQSGEEALAYLYEYYYKKLVEKKIL